MYSYRITTCDFYMSSPIRKLDVTFSEFKGTEIKQVPIVRIFGSTIDGQKACVHIHGVFPYFYIPYEGSEPPDRLKYQIAASLDKAINISLGQANALTQHVYKIILVSGIPFYGYHKKEHQFFKIYLFNPHMLKKAAELVQNGVVMGKVHQPHEAHIPFQQQFMIDYNLRGMNFINCLNILHRQYPEHLAECKENSNENSTSIASDAPLRVSCCEIEVDVAASDILNRNEILNQSVDNPGLAELWEDEYQRRREQGRETQPTPQTSQTRESKPCASEEFYRQRLVLKLEEMTQSSDDSVLTQPTQGSSNVIYPAEVPDGRSLLDASYIDLHTPHRLSKLMEQSEEDEDAGPSTSANFSQLMDSQDEDLLNVLGELAMSQEVEEQTVDMKPDADSIISSQEPDKLLLLSQQGTEVKEDDGDDEYFEMTQPISTLLASQEQPRNPIYDESNIIDESSSDTLIAASDEDDNMPSTSGLEKRNETSQNNLILSTESQPSLENNKTSDQLEIVDDESSSQNNPLSQTSLNASLLSELLNEDVWTEIDNIPQCDGMDDPIPSTNHPSKTKGRRLGARGPLIPNKPKSSPITPIPNSSNNSSPSIIACKKESLSPNSDSDILSNSQSSESISPVIKTSQENLRDTILLENKIEEDTESVNNSIISKLSPNDFNILLNVVESQQNSNPIDSNSSSNPIENSASLQPVSEQLVMGLCDTLSWSEGTTAMQLLEEELTDTTKKNIKKEHKPEIETERIRKSKRLSLRPKRRNPPTSSEQANTSRKTRTPPKSNTQDNPIPSTSSGGYISPISWRLRKNNPHNQNNPLIPVSINIKQKKGTFIKVLNVTKKRGRPSKLVTANFKRRKVSLEIDMPCNKITNMSVQFKPTSVSQKKITLTYDVESNEESNARLMDKYNIRSCRVNVEKLNDDFIKEALKRKDGNSSSQEFTEEIVHQIPEESFQESIPELSSQESIIKEIENEIPEKSYVPEENSLESKTIHEKSSRESKTIPAGCSPESGCTTEDTQHKNHDQHQVSSPDFILESSSNSNISDENEVSFLEKLSSGRSCTDQLKPDKEEDTSQDIENPYTSQSSNASSKNEVHAIKIINPMKKNQKTSPSKIRLVSKLKSSLKLGNIKKRVSFNSLDIVIEKSPIKKSENEEKHITRRKLSYQPSLFSTEISIEKSELSPIVIESESDSDIIENSDDETSETKYYQTKSLQSVKLLKIEKSSQKNQTQLQESGSESEHYAAKMSDVLIEQSNDDFNKKTIGTIKRSKSISESTDDSKYSQTKSENTSQESTEKYNEDSKCSFIFDSISNDSESTTNAELSFIEEDCENNLGIVSFYNLTQSQSSSPLHNESEIFSQETPIFENTTIQPNTIYEPIYNPPNYTEVIETLKENNLQELKHQEPYYSISTDVQNKSKEIGGRIIKLISHSACDLPEYQSNIVDTYTKTTSNIPLTNTIYIEPLLPAPSYNEVMSYFNKTDENNEKTPKKDTSLLRIQVPNSPGRENSDDESLSLSPCSDIQSQTWNPISPASNSQQSRSKSPLVHSTPMPKALAKCMTPRRLSANSDSCCRLDGPSPLNNTFGFRVALENLQDARAVIQPQQLTVFALELHISTRGELRPDPDTDPVGAAFFLVSKDDGLGSKEMGVIAVQPDKIPILSETRSKCNVMRVEDEKALVMKILEVVKKWDPDILLGYEIEMASWGYLIQRAAYLEMNLANLLSRVQKPDRGPVMRPIIQQDDVNKSSGQKPASQGVTYEVSELKVIGRIILNLWRIMKHEIAVQSYSFENMVYHILHERIPQHSFQTLTFWWNHPSKRYLWLVTDYWLYRVEGCSRLLAQLDILGRTSELAKLFGIQFYEVLSRGSQFRVESMMLRLAKPRNFVPVSPSIMQRAHMKAPECLPLILEPESKYYEDPVIVLDFQSLYPSIIIGYNYCFSTCLGRVEHLGQDGPFQFGCTQLRVPPKLVRKLSQSTNISPCGVAFVKSDIREGVLPRMLKEILDTRLMVKKSMKENKNDSRLQRVLHARQLGLKLIANVTYGYTAANFSGRMPCIEVGDSVVSKGRETLDRAIQMVHENVNKWGARVVYGDTDSLFVLVPGRTRQQAFEIGAEIAAAVTQDNPSPVKLKLEKVYHPCILQTKKRYVGYMYENPDQKDPVYEAKGIETVRRDGCPAVAKMLEKSLRILFETQDVSLIKSYVVRQYQKLLLGRINMQDLVFAKEFRGFAGYKPGACVPALELTRQWLRVDRRAEPRTGERVPYVVVSGAPGLPLIRLVRSPHDLLRDQTLRVNSEYYITRVIAPPLDRCFSLLGADVHQWYAEMPRRTISGLPTYSNHPGGTVRLKGTISQYFSTVECAVCRQQTREGLCIDCQTQPQKSALVLSDKVRRWERAVTNIAKICSSCCGRNFETSCCSLVCPILFRRNQADRDLEQGPFVRQLVTKFLDF